MGDKSKIQWTDSTWNVTYGCTRKSAGCDNCYAVRQTQRLAGSLPMAQGLVSTNEAGRSHFNGQLRLLEGRLDQPLRWRRPRRIFVNSLSDLFHPEVPFDYIDRVFATMALADHHEFQVLTKRPDRMAEWFRSNPTGRGNGDTLARVARVATMVAKARGENVHHPYWDMWLEAWPLSHIWLGTSVEDQAAADERIPHLLECPAAVRFLSAEPLLEPVDLRLGQSEGLPTDDEPFRERADLLHWVIAGGESGGRARPCDVGWIRSLVRQCGDAGVACFVKQLGARPKTNHQTRPEGEGSYWTHMLKHPKGGDIDEWPEDLRVRQYPEQFPRGRKEWTRWS